MTDISAAPDRRGPPARAGSESGARLLEAEEVARYLGMRTDWVYREVRAGRLPHIRLGRCGSAGSQSRRGLRRANVRHTTAGGGDRAIGTDSQSALAARPA
jgi:excisionase family DNA binding protein